MRREACSAGVFRLRIPALTRGNAALKMTMKNNFETYQSFSKASHTGVFDFHNSPNPTAWPPAYPHQYCKIQF